MVDPCRIHWGGEAALGQTKNDTMAAMRTAAEEASEKLELQIAFGSEATASDKVVEALFEDLETYRTP